MELLEKINKAALHFLVPLSLQETFSTIVREALSLTKAEEGAIVLATNDSLRVAYGSTPAIAAMQPKPKGYAFTAYKKRKALLVQKQAIQKYISDIAAQGVQAVLFLPLSYKKESIGALILRFHKEKRFTPEELKILTLFGSLATLAIKKTQLYDEAKNAIEIRDAFISLASHELRTPLTSINGYIQLLFSRVKGTQTTEAKWITELHRESIRLTGLIKDMLDISRLRANRLQLSYESVSIDSILSTAIQLHKDIHPDSEISMELNLPKGHDTIVADVEKLVHVFTAIFASFVKTSPTKNPTIHIEVAYQQQFITVTVCDKDKKSDYTNFERMFTGNVYKEGFGLGLILARQILEAHQAEATVTKTNDIPTISIRFPELGME